MNGQPSIVGLMNGSIAGLVAITPCSGYVSPSGSFFVGLCGGISCFFGIKIKKYFRFDDALDCFGIHAVGGIVGNLLVGCFAQEAIGGANGAFFGNGHQLIKQIYGTLFTITYSAVGTAIIFYSISITIGLRLSPKDERSGMDRVVHNTSMYSQLSAGNTNTKTKNDETKGGGQNDPRSGNFSDYSDSLNHDNIPSQVQSQSDVSS